LYRDTHARPCDRREKFCAPHRLDDIVVDPKSAQAWYLLGASLVGAMEYKKVGDKMEVVVQPGTVEAYQKAVELDPSGPYGQQAKQGLEALQQIAPGIDTKIRTKKKS